MGTISNLGFETWLDDQKMFDIDYVQLPTEISIPIIEDEGEHTLKLVLKGKQPSHTTINESGEIISDAKLQISNLAVDNIPLGQIVNEKTIYTHNFNGHSDVVKDQFFGVMGCNGTVELRFTTPIYLWLLENI